MKFDPDVILRVLMITATLLLSALPAKAECRLEVLKAAERLSTSGPFHFESIIHDKNGEQRIRGHAIPSERALEIHYLSGTQDERLAKIFKNGQLWVRDKFGWFGGNKDDPFSTLKSFLPDLGLIPPFTEQIECPGTVNVDGRNLRVYRVKNDYSLYVDPKTNLVVRHDKNRNEGRTQKSVTTYRYDSTISIKIPTVDLAQRERASYKAFEAARRQSDPVCRSEAFRALERGINSGPFHFEFRRYGHLHPYQAKGSLIPSRAVHLKDSIIGADGAKTEMIVLEGKTWWRRSNAAWQMTQDGSTYQKNINTVMDFFDPDVDEFLFTRCAGNLSVAGRSHRLYEFDIYRKRDHAYKPVESRRMLIDTKTALPVKTEKLDYYGKWILIEQRVYDPEIRIVPPE